MNLCKVIERTTVKSFIDFSDTETAILALKDAAARALPIVESCPVGDHQSNCSIDVSVGEFRRQRRAIRMQLENRLGIVLANDDPVLAWIPTCSGDAIARYHRGVDGKTPWERETGRT